MANISSLGLPFFIEVGLLQGGSPSAAACAKDCGQPMYNSAWWPSGHCSSDLSEDLKPSLVIESVLSVVVSWLESEAEWSPIAVSVTGGVPGVMSLVITPKRSIALTG
jgi:hypothetical protein